MALPVKKLQTNFISAMDMLQQYRGGYTMQETEMPRTDALTRRYEDARGNLLERANIGAEAIVALQSTEWELAAAHAEGENIHAKMRELDAMLIAALKDKELAEPRSHQRSEEAMTLREEIRKLAEDAAVYPDPNQPGGKIWDARIIGLIESAILAGIRLA